MTDEVKAPQGVGETMQSQVEVGLGITPEVAMKLLAIREALAHEDIEDAWLWLYKIADADMESFTPWAKLEALASQVEQSIQAETDSVNENQSRGFPRTESKATSKSSAEYTDLSCNSSETANAVWVYLNEQVKQQEEPPSIAAYVYKSTLRITYEGVRDRGEWDMQLLGYRDGYEATAQREGGSVSTTVESPSPASSLELFRCGECGISYLTPEQARSCHGPESSSSPERQDGTK